MLFILLCVLVLTLAYIWFYVYNSRIYRMTAHIPGPRPLPLIGTLYCGFKTTEFVDTIQRLVKDYGPVVSLWFGPFYCAAISDHKDIELIYKSNFEVNKAFLLYKKLLPWLGHGLVTAPSVEKWRKHRKLLTPAFHFKILEEFVPIFNRNAQMLTSVLRKNVATDIDMMKYLPRLTLDILCETALGIHLNAQLTENSKFLEASAKLSELSTIRTFNPFYYADFIFNMSRLGKESKQLTDYLNTVVDNVIQERQQILNTQTTDELTNVDDNIGQKKLRTFLDLLLDSRKSGGADFTDEDIRDEVHTFMFAGHDTTALTMSYFCYAVSQQPEIQEKLFEEQKLIFGDTEPDMVTSAHLSEMKYLEKTIKETLRLYPPSIFTMRTLKNDFELSNGYIIPAGGNIMILSYCAHLNPQVFPEPFKFDPDRFDSPLTSSQIFSYVPFSAGPRNCIGQKYAMIEMKIVLSHLVRNFKILQSTIPLKLAIEILLKSQTGIHVKLESRKP